MKQKESLKTLNIGDPALERASSAVTLSDMEIFVFPELLFSLVLANILSPRIWAWRDDPWFAGLARLSPYRKIVRLKQYLIDHYEFNLDLDTWGLTTQERELERFRSRIDENVLARSNALFGYEGDRYYFDIDIRRHFGLDKYTENVIPYWKTETVEAMDAFRFKPGYAQGAGECVSLSTLYAAALFVVCGIPLDDIFLMATPLHSQNFVLVGDSLLTNNRRVVTRNMWFNGTELTVKAQRALRHEQVTMVAHSTGHIHSVYSEATIDPAAYERFSGALRAFLRTDVNMEVLTSFLRQYRDHQQCFQFSHDRHGRPHYIPAETVYRYEQTSKWNVSDATRKRLLVEIEDDEFFPEPLSERILLNRLDAIFRQRALDPGRPEDFQRLVTELSCDCVHKRQALRDLGEFVRLEPRLPDHDRAVRFVESEPIRLDPSLPREAVFEILHALRARHPVVELAFHAARNLGLVDWAPFVKAAMERNPVSVRGSAGMSLAEAENHLRELPQDSIYDGTRAAQPDEVWNFGRGDGFEKALCFANLWRARHPGRPMTFRAQGDRVVLDLDGALTEWPGAKGLQGGFALD